MGQLRRRLVKVAALAAVAVAQALCLTSPAFGAGGNGEGIFTDAGADAVRAEVLLTAGGFTGTPHAGCSWVKLTPGSDAAAELDYATFKFEDGIFWQLWERTCGATTNTVWVPIVADPADLLARLLHDLRERQLPKPAIVLHELSHQFGWGYVHVPIDYRADPAQWQPVTATAAVDGPTPLWATVRATPTTLTFAPDDGNQPVTCDAAGALAQYEIKIPGSCSYTYHHASSTATDGHAFHPTVSIGWTIEWQSSRTAAWQALPGEQTSTTTDLAIAEVQAIITCTGPRPAQGGCT